MKNMRFFPLHCITALVVMMLITPIWAQTMHSGERSDDFTGIRRNMTRLNPTLCPDNKIAVGSNCIDLPSGSAVPSSWVKNYLGQTKCDGNNCASILQDGRIRFSGYVSYPIFQNNNPTSTYSFDTTVGIPFAWLGSSPQIITTAGTGLVDGGYIGACWTQPAAFPNMDVLNGVITGWTYSGTGVGYDCSHSGDPNWLPPPHGG